MIQPRIPDPVEQHVHRGNGHLPRWLGNGRQLDPGQPRERDIVEAHQGNVLRDPDARFCGRLHHADRQHVRRAEDGGLPSVSGKAFMRHRAAGLPRAAGMAAVYHARSDPELFTCGQISLQAELVRPAVRTGAEVQDPPVPKGIQVLHGSLHPVAVERKRVVQRAGSCPFGEDSLHVERVAAAEQAAILHVKAAAVFAAVFVAGFSVPLLANLLLFITILAISPAQIFNLSYPTSGGVFPNLVNNGHANLALLLYILWYSLAGGIWAVMNLGVSLLTTNGYVLVSAPFLLERVFSYIIQASSRTKPFLNYLDSSQGYALRHKNGVLIHLLLCVFLCAFAALSVHAATKRRLRHG